MQKIVATARVFPEKKEKEKSKIVRYFQSVRYFQLKRMRKPNFKCRLRDNKKRQIVVLAQMYEVRDPLEEEYKYIAIYL